MFYLQALARIGTVYEEFKNYTTDIPLGKNYRENRMRCGVGVNP
jgi:hypothetical protein